MAQLAFPQHAAQAQATVPPTPTATAAESVTGRYVLPFAVLQGAPDVRPGEELGYWLWHDDAGLHLRTTGPGPQQRFNGVLRVRGEGSFQDVERVRLEHVEVNQDRASTGPGERTILFHFDTYGGVDGVDFKLLGSSYCVELIANGQEVPGETRLGQAQVRPDQLPVCFQR